MATHTVLMYHAIPEDARAEAGVDPHYSVLRDQFAAHLQLIAECGARAASVRAMLDSPAGSRLVGVTFDDGHRSNHTAAAMLRDARSAGVQGVLHCFTGSHALADAGIDAGWYVSFSGIVTFKKWSDDALLRMVPTDRLLVESDAPYLAPVPHRGKRNESAFVALTLARIADARDTDPRALGSLVLDNTARLFQLH